jgi:hypothetical protein
MNNLLDVTNVADPRAIAETNFQRIDASAAFGMYPSINPATGLPTVNIGPPNVGAFVVGQCFTDAALGVWRCSVAGTPGTWIQIQPAAIASLAAAPGGPTLNYWVILTGQQFQQFYWSGSAWTAVP